MLNDIRAPTLFINELTHNELFRAWANALYMKVTLGKCKTILPVKFYFDIIAPLYTVSDNVKIDRELFKDYSIEMEIAAAIEGYTSISKTVKEYREMCKIYTSYIASVKFPGQTGLARPYFVGAVLNS